MEGQTQITTRRPAVQRFQRFLFVVTLIGLVASGLPQTYAAESIAQFVIKIMGGIESVRIIHRALAVVLILSALLHVLTALYDRSVLGQRERWWASLRDFGRLIGRLLENLGLKPVADADTRFVLRIEYLILVISVVLMTLTGFALWNPLAVTSILPGETIPTARSLHSDHAILLMAFLLAWRALVILFWRPKPAVERTPEPDAATVAERRRRFVPIAAIVSALALVGLYAFLTGEQTAIETLPQRQVVVFAPQLVLDEGDAQVGAALWGTLRCAFCHGDAAQGGLNGEPALMGTDLTFEDFYTQVRTGEGAMPAFSRVELPDAYVQHLWAYLGGEAE